MSLCTRPHTPEHLDGRSLGYLRVGIMFYGLNIRPFFADPVIKTPDYVYVLVMSSLSDFYLGALHISVLLKCKPSH